jgi:CheY-like chemotaxis protein
MPTPPHRSESGVRPSIGRVLVIDDDAMVANSIARSLSGVHMVTVVNSAADGLALLASGRRFDVILCDVMMPGMSGMDLFERLREVAPSEVDRLVFVTGCALVPEVRAFLDRVSNTCLEKPFDIAALQAFVERRVRREFDEQHDATGVG